MFIREIHLNSLFCIRNIEKDMYFFVQGLLTGFDIFWQPQRPTKNKFLVKMIVSVNFWGIGIKVSSISFLKSSIGWPQQLLTEKVLKFNMSFQDSVKKFFFPKLQNKWPQQLLQTYFLKRNPYSYGLIINGTKMTNTSHFLWNGSKIQFFINMWYTFWWRLLRPAYVTFSKTCWWNSNAQASKIHRYFHFDQKLVFRWSPWSLKYIKTGRKTLYMHTQKPKKFSPSSTYNFTQLSIVN